MKGARLIPTLPTTNLAWKAWTLQISALCSFAFANGRSGGNETIVGFKIGVDIISLQDYAEGEIGRALNSAAPTPGTSAGLSSTTLTLSDNTRITFRDLSGVDGRFFR